MIYCQSSETMEQLEDGSVALVVTSPPYHVGKEFDVIGPDADYLALLERVFREVYRVLEPGCRCVINVANVGRDPYTPRNYQIGGIMLGLGFIMRGEIIWSKMAGSMKSCTAWGSWGSSANPSLRDTHEYCLVFSKPNQEGGQLRLSKGVSTINKADFIDWTRSVWTIRPESATRIGHPAPYPVELPRRFIELYSFKDDLILDPFMGAASTAIAAHRSGRRWVGYELSPEYKALADRRIEAELMQVRFEFGQEDAA